ncbi:MAG: TraB/GumN family protein [Candidatus Sericytochromatia bacterium]|nr:TraB/GumN family protein [Candidatus Sericytochromatia bacterium]
MLCMNTPPETLHSKEPVYRLQHKGREVILIGTAHISQASADLVAEMIEREQPDTVCVELCPTRYKTLIEPDAWKNTDIVEVIRQKRTFVLMLNLILSSIQRRMAREMNVQPGLEMRVAIERAEAQQAEVATIDREVRTTLQRVWRLMGWWTKMKLMNQLLISIFDNDSESVSEEQIEALKEKGALEMLLDEMGTHLPGVKQRLIDERDLYMVQKIREAPGQKLLAVVGAGHVPGMLKNWEKPDISLTELDSLPPVSIWSTLLKWLIPLVIIALIGAGFLQADPAEAVEKGLRGLVGWFVVNGALSGLGGIIAGAHPLTTLVAIVAAPLTSLNPLIGVGYVAGLVEAWLRKPRVRDFEELSEAIMSLKGWWHNKVTRILLVFFLTSIGSMIGTFVGYGWLIDNLMR